MADTTKKNMGRRQNPVCAACTKRVAKPEDEYCPKCMGLSRAVAKPFRHRVTRRGNL